MAGMGSRIRTWIDGPYGPAIFASSLFLLGTFALAAAALVRTGGTFGYKLDDATIHLATAKNLAEHGVWGLSSHGFVHAESSLLWPALLALLVFVLGDSILWPFVLNLAAGIGALFAAAWWMHGSRSPPTRRGELAILVALVALAPMVRMPLAGMEHLLHLAVVVVFVGLVAGATSGQRGPAWLLPLTAAALTAVRYDGMFMVVAAAGLLFAMRQARAALSVLVAGALPIIGFGLIAIDQGWHLLPTSILVKSSAGDPSGLVAAMSKRLLEAPIYKVAPVFGAAGLLWMNAQRGLSLRSREQVAAFLLLAAAGGQWLLTSDGSMRHAFMLHGMILLLIGHRLATGLPRLTGPTWERTVPIAALLLVIAPTSIIGVGQTLVTPEGVDAIHSQQGQMGRFVAAHYPDGVVVLNDIGEVAYRSDALILDYFGLGSKEVLDAKRAGHYNTDWLANWTHDEDADLAIVYDGWVHNAVGVIPESWIRVATWRIPHNVAVSGPVVTFYAVTEEPLVLLAALDDFAPRLPPDVVYRRLYDPDATDLAT